MNRQSVAIIGARGQLGTELMRAFGSASRTIALDRDSFDLADPDCGAMLRELGPDLVLLPAAYTNVDGCAQDPDLAHRINALGPRYVATACRDLGIPLVYMSTNEVFDGAATAPYREDAPASPINAYGRSKWEGERAVRELLGDHLIARVAWLFGGQRNFVRTILRLAGERPTLRVVADEIGSPTYAADVADALERLIGLGARGTFHLINDGACSRHELAVETLRLAGRDDVAVEPIALADFARASRVPPYTPLANTAAAALGVELRPWRLALAAYLATQ